MVPPGKFGSTMVADRLNIVVALAWNGGVGVSGGSHCDWLLF